LRPLGADYLFGVQLPLSALATAPSSPVRWVVSFHGAFLVFFLRPNPKHADTMDVVFPSRMNRGGSLDSIAPAIFAAMGHVRLADRISGHLHGEDVVLPPRLEVAGGILDLRNEAEPVFRSPEGSLRLRFGRWTAPVLEPAALQAIEIPEVIRPAALALS
jgi:hypothetical protein